MARVPYLEEKDLSVENRDLLKRNLNLYRALANSPDTARAFQALGMHIRFHMKLDARLRELAILQVGYLTRTPYEYAHHIEIGRQFGVTDADLAALAAESRGETSTLPALDRAVLRAARELVTGTRVSDATFAELAAGLDAERLVDLVASIAFYCGVVRVLGSLGIELEDGYEPLLQQFPLPPG